MARPSWSAANIGLLYRCNDCFDSKLRRDKHRGPKVLLHGHYSIAHHQCAVQLAAWLQRRCHYLYI
jgi:hypothetical protein